MGSSLITEKRSHAVQQGHGETFARYTGNVTWNVTALPRRATPPTAGRGKKKEKRKGKKEGKKEGKKKGKDKGKKEGKKEKKECLESLFINKFPGKMLIEARRVWLEHVSTTAQVVQAVGLL